MTWQSLATPRAVFALLGAAATPFGLAAQGQMSFTAASICGAVAAIMAAHNWFTPSPGAQQ